MTKTERARRAKIVAYCHTAEKVRIKLKGEVHCYGEMPGNAARKGWYFAGFVDHIEDAIQLREQDLA